MNLILFGFKSCGKTTLGKIIAVRMGRPFLDTDRLVETLYYTRTGEKKNYRDIFKTLGVDGFRELESDVAQQLKTAKNTIISLGGGLILNARNAALLAKFGQLVYLKLSKESLKTRILRRELPAYLDPLDPEGSFEQMYMQRLQIYEKLPSLVVDLEAKTQDQVVTQLCALIQKREMENG
jgi:shikimate kinase